MPDKRNRRGKDSERVVVRGRSIPCTTMTAVRSDLARCACQGGKIASHIRTLEAVVPYCSNEHYWQVYFDTNPEDLRRAKTA
jgi:hypothetical protein